jgi:tRNA pseudouridine38-40 synthase
MIKNFKLVIEYDGTAYCGWQRQKNDPTIQEAIETAISNMTQQKITLNGSGRTDAGVHAYGQVANFCCETRLTADVFQKGLNGLLPDDIVIRACEPVSETFHARYDAKSKTYRYRILNQAIPAALYRQYSWHIKKTLNMESMQAALTGIVGTQDFKAFEGTGSPRAHTVRTVMKAQLTGEQGFVTLNIKANGFLKFMVRNIMGTLVDIGLGKRTPGDIETILASKDRNQASATAPPHGLFLMSVDYE